MRCQFTGSPLTISPGYVNQFPDLRPIFRLSTQARYYCHRLVPHKPYDDSMCFFRFQVHFWLSFQKRYRYVFEFRNEEQKSKSNPELLSGLDYELSIVKYDFK
jgi:hypothetical protein